MRHNENPAQFYFTGRPCKRGHICKRYVSGRECFECKREYAKGRPYRTGKTDPKKHREACARYRERNREEIRRHHRKRKGLPEAPYPAPNECEICHRSPPINGKGLCLDHDHVTGLFRGWICSPCNVALGVFQDDVESLRGAVEYLDRFIKSRSD